LAWHRYPIWGRDLLKDECANITHPPAPHILPRGGAARVELHVAGPQLLRTGRPLLTVDVVRREDGIEVRTSEIMTISVEDAREIDDAQNDDECPPSEHGRANAQAVVNDMETALRPGMVKETVKPGREGTAPQATWQTGGLPKGTRIMYTVHQFLSR
jgi:hypothetical protein